VGFNLGNASIEAALSLDIFGYQLSVINNQQEAACERRPAIIEPE
jgi:hypothetical protein